MGKKIININEATKNTVKLEDELFRNITWEDELESVEPKITASRHANRIKIAYDENNYIKSKLMLSRGQRKEYDAVGLENFELNKETRDISFKESTDLKSIVSTDKTTKLEALLYTEICFNGKIISVEEDSLKESDALLELRNKLIKVLVQFNELGL
ncbi:MAG: hypothetical protein ACRC23_01620 [Aeromonas jandaei]